MTQSLITTTQYIDCLHWLLHEIPAYLLDVQAYYMYTGLHWLLLELTLLELCLYWNTAALAATENSNDHLNSPLAFYTGTQQFLEIY